MYKNKVSTMVLIKTAIDKEWAINIILQHSTDDE